MEGDETNLSEVEPPAGLVFSSINPTDIFANMTTSGGYDVIEKPYNEDDIQNHKKQKIFRPKRFTTTYQKFDERRLRILANSGYIKELEHFLESCPTLAESINKSDNKNRTALHFAASRGFDEIVHSLLRHGANPNVQDFNGNTPLHLAACTQHIRVVTLLMKYGADIEKTDSFGKTPLHLSLSRLRMLQSRPIKDNSYAASKRKADVAEIFAMLQEYFDQSGLHIENLKLCEINKKLLEVQTQQQVDEVGALLVDFTQMNIDATSKK